MGAIPLQQHLQLALEHQQAGRLREAEQIYRQIIHAHPNHALPIHHLGILYAQVGNYQMGADLMRRAIALQPDWPEAYANLGKMLMDAGQLEAAAEACNKAIAIRADCYIAHNNLGGIFRIQGRLEESAACSRAAIAARQNYPEAYTSLSATLQEQGKFDEAIAAARNAISLRPSYAEAYNNLGLALQAKGELAAAVDAYRLAITHAPRLAEAYSNLGSTLLAKGLTDQAIVIVRQALSLRPHFPQALLNLSLALKDKKQWDESVISCRQAIDLYPTYYEAWNNLGILLTEQYQFDEAISSLRHAVQLKPNVATAYHNLSTALRSVGRFDEASAAAQTALSICPDYPEAHYDLGVIHLLRGELEQGWPEYEWRLKFSDPAPRQFDKPTWDGSHLQNGTILLHAEQGQGDIIQFIRYWPMVAERVGKVVIQCQSSLKRLLQVSLPSCEIVEENESPPSFDVHCSIMSLPWIFGTDLKTIPASVPYLRYDNGQTICWQKRLLELSSRLKVGLVWRGNPNFQNDRKRSIPLEKLVSFFRVSDVDFISLQKNPPIADGASFPNPSIDWVSEITDFADTAALISQLDLIISVDTAVAHLAGAIGKPIWILLPAIPDWRWLLDRNDSPWYPSMKLFRQSSDGIWSDVVARVTDELSQWKKTV